MIEKLQKAFAFEEQALRLRSTRQQILSENVANETTPGYKARDIDFASALSSKMGMSDVSARASSTAVTDQRHIQMGIDGGGVDGLQYRVPHQSSVDGNTVEVESEKARVADNAMHYMSVTNNLQQRFLWWSRFLQETR